jgi:hypothetical protein
MALDVVMFAVLVWAPTGGHPSLEALVLVWTAVLKAVLAPVTVAALAVGLLTGERTTIALGLACAIGETVVPLPSVYRITRFTGFCSTNRQSAARSHAIDERRVRGLESPRYVTPPAATRARSS